MNKQNGARINMQSRVNEDSASKFFILVHKPPFEFISALIAFTKKSHVTRTEWKT